MTILIPAPAPAVASPAQILADAITLMQARGRAYGVYDTSIGELCALGAMAVAAHKDADVWESLRGSFPHWLEAGDEELIEAARDLAMVVDNTINRDDLLIEDLVELIGKWHDGPVDQIGKLPAPPENSAVFAAFAEAARLADMAGDAA